MRRPRDHRAANGSAGRAPERRSASAVEISSRSPAAWPRSAAAGFNATTGVRGAKPTSPGRREARQGPDLRYRRGRLGSERPVEPRFQQGPLLQRHPALWSGLMKFNADFSRCRTWPRKSSPTRTARCGHSRSARTPSGRTARRCTARTSSGRGSASWIRPARPRTPATSTTSRTAEAYNKSKVTDASQVGVVAKDDWTLEVTLEGPRGYFPVLAAYAAALPAHRASVEKFGDKWTEAGNIVCNGPFTLEAWEHNKVNRAPEEQALLRTPRTCTLEKVAIPIIPVQSGAAAVREQRARHHRAAGRRPQAAARRSQDRQGGIPLSRSRAPGT